MARSLGYSAQVITENLITDVDLLQRLPDGTEVVLVPGDEITVAGGRLQLACLFDELKALLAGG